MNSSELATKLSEYRGRKTHPRLIRRAIIKGAPHGLDPLTGKPMFFWSSFIAWYEGELKKVK